MEKPELAALILSELKRQAKSNECQPDIGEVDSDGDIFIEGTVNLQQLSTAILEALQNESECLPLSQKFMPWE